MRGFVSGLCKSESLSLSRFFSTRLHVATEHVEGIQIIGKNLHVNLVKSAYKNHVYNSFSDFYKWFSSLKLIEFFHKLLHLDVYISMALIFN